MTYQDIENVARELVLSAMRNDERNMEDIDNPTSGSYIDNFVKAFYEIEGDIAGSLLTIILKDKYEINYKI